MIDNPDSGITAVATGNRGSGIGDTPAGDSDPQSQRETLSSTFDAFDKRQPDAVGTDFLPEQQDFAIVGWASRRQQQFPDIRFVKEQWH